MANDNARSTPQSMVSKGPGKKGSTSVENTLDPQVVITEESDEKEVGVTITPDFIKNHLETLKAKLAELEHKEKLEKLKAQLSYDEGEPDEFLKNPVTMRSKEVLREDGGETHPSSHNMTTWAVVI
ncbi:hypothetical protein E3N88_42258 [Mikania micrantha]|uniref:Uncharacterized protein n=1 Tax=Mikania micrantha TaxID=192012 RepID=A0A5N6LBX3_9ASTR|nr:hypothetical protein E3N88_45316 [Mikania micrantha]KAD1813794.1 hypothetical protein E3N88_42258 [Mikania micrantha]